MVVKITMRSDIGLVLFLEVLYCFYTLPKKAETKARTAAAERRAEAPDASPAHHPGAAASRRVDHYRRRPRRRSRVAGHAAARHEYDQLAASISRQRAENARLRDPGRRLREDPARIEEIARRELGLIKPGERVFIVKDVPPAKAPAPRLPPESSRPQHFAAATATAPDARLASAPIFVSSSSGPGGNDAVAKNRATVKPIPLAIRRRPRRPRLKVIGNRRPAATASAGRDAMPSGFPAIRPAATPHVPVRIGSAARPR
jgi:cell division protein FtsB